MKNRHYFVLGIIALAIVSIMSMIGCGSGAAGGGGGGGGTTLYSLTLTVSSEVPTAEVFGSIEASPYATSYPSGTTVTIEASALCSCHMFSSWEGSVSGETTPMTITMDSSKKITARFKLIPPGTKYDLNLYASPDSGAGDVYESGTGPYDPGTVVVLSAEANSGHIFDHWTINGSNGGSANPRTLSMNGTKEVYAVFKHLYTMSITVVGSGTVEPYGGVYIEGSTAVLTAEPIGTNYAFSSWEGNASGTSKTVTVLMNGNKNVTAYFGAAYSLGVTVTPAGAGTVEPYGGKYADGSTAVITVEAGTNYVFSSWEGDASGTSDTTTVLMNGNKNVIAHFIRVYSLVVSGVFPTGSGTVEPYGGKYLNGLTAILTAEPASDYVFSYWSRSGYANVTSETMTILMDNNNYVKAYFTHIPILSVSVSPAGSGTVEPYGGSYTNGSTATITADASTNYVFSSWSGAASGTSETTTVLMNGNKNVTANFAHLYDLHVAVSPTGSGTVEPYGGKYISGTVVKLTAEANSGYTFSNWSGSLSGSTNPANLTMNGNKTVTANFTANPTTTRAYLGYDAQLYDQTGSKCWTHMLVSPDASPKTFYMDLMDGSWTLNGTWEPLSDGFSEITDYTASGFTPGSSACPYYYESPLRLAFWAIGSGEGDVGIWTEAPTSSPIHDTSTYVLTRCPYSGRYNITCTGDEIYYTISFEAGSSHNCYLSLYGMDGTPHGSVATTLTYSNGLLTSPTLGSGGDVGRFCLSPSGMMMGAACSPTDGNTFMIGGKETTYHSGDLTGRSFVGLWADKSKTNYIAGAGNASGVNISKIDDPGTSSDYSGINPGSITLEAELRKGVHSGKLTAGGSTYDCDIVFTKVGLPIGKIMLVGVVSMDATSNPDEYEVGHFFLIEK